MDSNVKVVTIDWRRFGDFSAVGQLTKKIFAEFERIELYPIQCVDRVFCKVSKCNDGGPLEAVFENNVTHDAVQNYIKKNCLTTIYLRLSPNIGVLELACKLIATQPSISLIVHYMDKPSLSGDTISKANYIKAMYHFLTARAASVYTISRDSQQWLLDNYGCTSRVLANFTKSIPDIRLDIKSLEKRDLKISYFGSVDPNMNSEALAFFCRLVASCPWIKFSIWTNSHEVNLHTLRKISNSCVNINIANSNLDVNSYKLKLKEADFLLIAYDHECNELLQHSFSNKFIDYLEAGSFILCFGPPEAPVVKSCQELGLPLVFKTEEELSLACQSKERLLGTLANFDLNKYKSHIRLMKKAQLEGVISFLTDLQNITNDKSPSCSIDKPHNSKQLIESDKQMQQLSFLIRRKYYDRMTGQQSLSATIMAALLRAQGYRGLDYEI